MAYTQKTICPYDCPAACGLLAETDGTRLLAVRGDKDHPMAKGLICRKMQSYEKSVNSPRPDSYPPKKGGGKGRGQICADYLGGGSERDCRKISGDP